MEGAEHSLVPEWLRFTGNVGGGGTSVRHSDTSTKQSPRSRTVRSNSEKNRSSVSDSRSSLSSNSSEKHPYSSFTRSHHNRNPVREKEKSFSDDTWNHGSLDPLASILTCGVERIGFRRSQSLISRKPGEMLTHTVEEYKKSRHSSSNVVPSVGSNHSGTEKSAFEMDFPSLGTEEKQDMNGNGRVLSSGLSSAVESLPIGNSGFLGGERWTSALAEVPAILANNSVGHSPRQQNLVTSCAGGLNMAEALSQTPARVRVSPQLPDKSQRLEELAIKQSRQLIPMTPPKTLSLNSGDKSKQPKITVKTKETSKVIQLQQPHSPHLSNHSRGGHIISDSPSTTSHIGKFLVLKPGRENASISAGDANYRVILNSQVANSPSPQTASTSPRNSMVSSVGDKVAALSLNSKSNMEKRSSQSLAQSRSEFFNLMRRKKTPNNATTARSDSSLAVSSPGEEKIKEGRVRESRSLLENGDQFICNANGHYSPDKSKNSSDIGENNLFCNGRICPEEEEAAFLRSLGWEENGGEDEGLTEEEISAFYQEYMNRRPSLKECGISQPKSSTQPAIFSSESSSSESEA